MIQSVAEYFLQQKFLRTAVGSINDAHTLLRWGQKISQDAAPENVYRDREGRRTLRFEQNGHAYFLKLHTGVGWREIFKNLLSLRLPVLGAGNEYRAVRALERADVATLTVAAYASSGINPARRQSLIVTDALLATVSLEDFCAGWPDTAPPFAVRLALIGAVANVARRMHEAGVNHRDFYLCHFHLEEQSLAVRTPSLTPHCHLIDLHRAQLRTRTPQRWRVKDLAGLYFSAMDCGLTQRDCLRFIRLYCPGGLREALTKGAPFWRRVEARAQQLYAKGPQG